MNSCACGNLAYGNGTTCRRCSSLHELGLNADATEAEVKTAYRLYVKAWHPDRFPGDEKSKSAAQEKLKTINSAYNFLTSPSSKKYQPYRPNATPPPVKPQERAQQPSPVGGRSQASPPKGNTGVQTPPPTPSVTHSWGIFLGSLAKEFSKAFSGAPPWVKFTFVVLLAATFAGVWIYWPNPPKSPDADIRDFNIPKDSTPIPSIQAPKGVTLDDQPAFSLPNGTEIRKRRRLIGYGELSVENGTSFDAVIHLIDMNTEKTIRTFYVKSGNTFTERQIAPGLYGLYYTTGIDWNVALKKFNSSTSYNQFGKNLEYTEKRDPDAGKIEYSIHNITLQPVQDGNVATYPTSKEAFDKMMNDGTTD
jgi:hypothetical protein